MTFQTRAAQTKFCHLENKLKAVLNYPGAEVYYNKLVRIHLKQCLGFVSIILNFYSLKQPG